MVEDYKNWSKKANVDYLMRGKNNCKRDNYREWDIFQYKSLNLKIYYTVKTDFKKIRNKWYHL